MNVITGLRRWRHNPLCRTTDLAEAWAALTAALLLVLAAPAAGVICGILADSALQKTVRAQHEQRHLATGTVLRLTPDRRRGPHDVSTRVVAKWRAMDGSTHTGTLSAPGRDARAGTTFHFWTDTRGEPANGPVSGGAARIRAVLAGVGAAALAAVLVECGRRLFVWRLVQRRYRRLDRAWAEAGPDWGRAGADS
ncbi:hypothetical protein [Streptomyces sp. NPDC088725]|uniref:Rv1733c family protein n=1 Tax=Streptomyces sp. NPDC088725 TaxID=3365873 RepID=UPI003814803C